jgi:hypothetical protein
MKQTEEKVASIAIKVINDVGWLFDKSKGVRPLSTSLEEQYEKYKKFEGFEKNKHKIFAFWDVIFDFPEDDNWRGRNIMWVLIKDDTGEPYEIGHRQYKGKVIKNSQGKYEIEDY